jgi:MFS family permease
VDADAEARRKRAVLAAVCLAALVLPLSFAGAVVALPAIARDLGGGPVALGWVVNGFMLSFGSCLMGAGSLADRHGRRRVFVLGVGLFALASLCIGLSPDLLTVNLLRAAQGVGAAGALAGGSAVLAQEYEGPGRARAFGLLGTTFGVGLALGPVLTGLLVEGLGWRAVFLSGTFLGALALGFGPRRMRESRDPEADRTDWPGIASFTLALLALTYGLLQAPETGWTSTETLLALSLAAAGAWAFVQLEKRHPRPMLDLSLFRYPLFLGVQVLPMATCFCYVVLLVVLPIRFIGIEGWSETRAGLMMFSLSAPMLAVPLLAARLADRLAPHALSGAGLLVAAAGLAGLAFLGPGASPVLLAGCMFTAGLGAAVPWGLMDGLSVSVVPRERAGMATGIFSTTRVAGEGVSIAVAGALLALFSSRGLERLTAGGPGREILARAAQRLASGDLERTAGLLPEVAREALVRAYAYAFQDLLLLLCALTVASAALIVMLFRRSGAARAG